MQVKINKSFAIFLKKQLSTDYFEPVCNYDKIRLLTKNEPLTLTKKWTGQTFCDFSRNCVNFVNCVNWVNQINCINCVNCVLGINCLWVAAQLVMGTEGEEYRNRSQPTQCCGAKIPRKILETKGNVYAVYTYIQKYVTPSSTYWTTWRKPI